ncbi:MAG TPA: Arm DNA-binding domain-containing protein [Chromatiaceae bacterium]|nr:Arm DNA-binding domain-containing protein [Chromatiaceae bacterium]
MEQISKQARKDPLTTERQARAIHWEGKDRLVSAGDRLYLNVRQNSKTWLIRRRLPSGKMVVRTLGQYPTMSVREARAIAVAEGMKKVLSNMTVKDLAETYFDEVVKIEHRRPELIRGYLDRGILPELGDRRITELNPADIAAAILAYRERGPRTADQLRSVLRALFTFAVENGIRSDNPAAPLTRRVSGYRPKARERVLTDDELVKVWSITHEHGRLLRFLLLTGLRITEAQKGERDGHRWHVSAALSKNKRPH